LAPVIGTHYAAETSDTGFAGAVNSQGGYGAIVPLDLPPAKGGLPVPLSVVYGGSHVGAAGVGWDVPLSYIYHSKTIAHHRPKPAPFFSVDTPIPINSPDLVILTLLGERVDLVRNAANTAWVGRHGSEQLEVRDRGNGTMVAYDGQGLTYNFSAQGGCAGCRLDNGNLFTLVSIIAPGGNSVQLSYKFGTPMLPGGGTGLSIDLTNVRYNAKPTGNCFKDDVALAYDAPSATPLSMSVLGSTVLTRMHKLTDIDVTRAGNSSDPAVCATVPQSLRKYTFTYQADFDTGQPRLQKVTMIGQQGTPERNVTLPIATYYYGKVTGNGTISYQKTQSITLPRLTPPVVTYGLSYTSAFPGADPLHFTLLSPQRLIDLTGDGRPDLVSELGVFRNIPGDSNGTTAFTLPSPSWLPSGEESRTTNFAPRYGRGTPSASKLLNRVDVLKMYIDMNGDGRIDFVDAQTDVNKWIVHLNTPDPTDPQKSVDIVRTISTAPMRAAINKLGGPAFTRIFPNEPVPLARITAVEDATFDTCWRWSVLTTTPVWFPTDPKNCPDFPSDSRQVKPEKTITEWALMDVNGDGYPDFVYNEARIADSDPGDPPSSPGTVLGETTITSTPADLYGSKKVMALVNTIGVHLTNNDDVAFASPVLLTDDGCGVARWQAAPGAASASELSETCGFEDVNGDGLVDRVTSVYNNVFISTAALGTGDADHPFSTGATIALPGPLARNSTVMISQSDGIYVPASCASGQTYYDTQRTAGLHDINGDGIPDYITSVDTSAGRLWRIQLGTGTGFAPAVSAASPVGLELSLERNTCTNTNVVMPGEGTTRTPIGLYDLDGDGQPEVVAMNFATLQLDVYQLTSPDPISWIGHTSPGVPSAGRLIAVDNGYGAISRIDYRSAKENGTTRHDVPYPEIVVTAEGVTDSAGKLLSAVTTYANGGAELIFDSAEDRFIFPGYQRTVSKVTTDDATVDGDGIATITDTYALAPFVSTMDAAARFKRYRTLGRVSDITTLSGFLDNDAWGLLATNITNDSRRTAGTHYDWDTRLLATGPAAATNERCVEMMYPYDFTRSLANQLTSNNDECAKHGFVFPASVYASRGTPGTTDMSQSTHVLRSAAILEGIDDLGRTTLVRKNNDLMRSDDDVCLQVTYATPSGTEARVLNAPASRTATDCSTQPKTLAHESWEYDGMKPTSTDPTVRVSNGFVTSHIVSRIDLDTFVSLGEIRDFDTTYDSIGNPLTVTKTRDDGAAQKVTITYDAFGLTPLTVETEGTKLPSQQTTFIRDPVTLRPTAATDANGTKLGFTYDGFDRLTQTSVTPPIGPAGVLSTTSYNGFAAGSSTDRNIARKVFADPVAPAALNTAIGRVATTYFDSLGRQTRTEMQLGTDYASARLIVGQRIYDALGRVHFMADPFPATDNPGTAYGTTHFFHADGIPECSIRGQGPQQTTSLTDEAKEIYPTCFGHTFENNQEIVSLRDAASLLPTSPQAAVVNTIVRTAIGRLIEHSTRLQLGPALERTTLSYDAFGHTTSVTRYQNPVTQSGAVTARWHYDSLGWMNRLEEPDVAPQARTFNNWGQVTQVQWCDNKSLPPCPATDRRSLMTYDALGRLIHEEDRINNTTIAETVHDYIYDVRLNNTTPSVLATNMIGRLAKATSPTSSVSFSYDSFGRANAQIFTDRTATANDVYVQKQDYHADGSLQTLHFLLPDNAFKDEAVEYVYDSAGRPRSVRYVVDATNTELFTAAGSTDVDVLGRYRQAKYGLATYTAGYAEAGRRLLSYTRVSSPDGKFREIAHQSQWRGSALFPPITNYPAYDPVARMVTREERTQEPSSLKTTVTRYDALGRLESVWNLPQEQLMEPPLPPELQRMFSYDPLDNLATESDSTAGSPGAVTLRYQMVDPDRLCNIAYAAATPAPVCDVKYDGAGNTLNEPTRAGGTRSFSYFPSGSVHTVTLGANATFDYDAFGAVQRLTLSSTSSPDTRNDKHFGNLIYRRDELVSGAKKSVITRSIPGPGGLIATRHGSNTDDPWTFAFGETSGTRFVTDQTGAFVQDIEYQPYGEVTSTDAQPGSQKYTNSQWNRGDALVALGLVQLGMRLYDPVIGRFLSRDPVFDPANRNPYAFAANDPINHADPTGLQGEVDPNGTPQPLPGCIFIWCGAGPGGGTGGGGSGGAQGPKPEPQEPHTSTTASGGVPPGAQPIDPALAKAMHNEAMYQAEQARICGKDPDSPFCDTKPHPDDMLGQTLGGFISSFVGVPSYYLKTEVSRAGRQSAQTGPEYFAALDRYNAARANIALSRINEETARFFGAAMMLSGALIDLGGAGSRSGGSAAARIASNAFSSAIEEAGPTLVAATRGGGPLTGVRVQLAPTELVAADLRFTLNSDLMVQFENSVRDIATQAPNFARPAGFNPLQILERNFNWGAIRFLYDARRDVVTIVGIRFPVDP
jgi:RHS repeat-associated protein